MTTQGVPWLSSCIVPFTAATCKTSNFFSHFVSQSDLKIPSGVVICAADKEPLSHTTVQSIPCRVHMDPQMFLLKT